MADVRLDIREGAFAARKNGSIIVPGHPEQSLSSSAFFPRTPASACRRYFHTRRSLPNRSRLYSVGSSRVRMGTALGLSRSTGPAAFTRHKERQLGRKIRSIDSCLPNWRQTALRPAEEADRPNLIRRVTLDLTGLPPTPKEVEAFVNDPSPRLRKSSRPPVGLASLRRTSGPLLAGRRSLWR